MNGCSFPVVAGGSKLVTGRMVLLIHGWGSSLVVVGGASWVAAWDISRVSLWGSSWVLWIHEVEVEWHVNLKKKKDFKNLKKILKSLKKKKKIISYQWPCCFVLYYYNFFRNSNIIFDNSGGCMTSWWGLQNNLQLLSYPTVCMSEFRASQLESNPWVWLSFRLVSHVWCSGDS